MAHYPDPESRARRLTLLEQRGRHYAAERIARRFVKLATGDEFGIEGFTVGEGWHRETVDFVNVGETYGETLVRVGSHGGEWRWSSWGDECEAAEQAYSEATGEHRCAYCGEWSDYVDDESRGACCGAVDPDSIDVDDVRDAVARTLFVVAYADASDREVDDREGTIFADDPPAFERAGPGEDWDDVVPDIDVPGATRAAAELLAAVAEINGRTVERLAADWMAASGIDDVERFGHALAMQALGTGVGLSDDVSPRATYTRPRTPDVETVMFEPDGSDFSSSLDRRFA